MGYDCTLHVVDPVRIRDGFCRDVIASNPPPTTLTAQNWESLSSMLHTSVEPAKAAQALALGALAFAAVDLPYHYERGFCLSLWQDHMEEERLQATVPKKQLGTPRDLDELFSPLIAHRPELRGRFSLELDSNYSTGIYIP